MKIFETVTLIIAQQVAADGVIAARIPETIVERRTVTKVAELKTRLAGAVERTNRVGTNLTRTLFSTSLINHAFQRNSPCTSVDTHQCQRMRLNHSQV